MLLTPDSKARENPTRWRSYTAASASAAALVAGSVASGAIVYRDFSSSPLTATGTNLLGLDFDNAGGNEITIGGFVSTGTTDNQRFFQGAGSAISSGNYALRLAANYVISAGRAFGANKVLHRSTFGASLGNFVNTRGFVGVKFNLGGIKYGWIDYEANSESLGSIVYGIAYETSGGSIMAGQTSGGPAAGAPEPATTGLVALTMLAAGAAGLVRHRKLRAAAAQETAVSA